MSDLNATYVAQTSSSPLPVKDLRALAGRITAALFFISGALVALYASIASDWSQPVVSLVAAELTAGVICFSFPWHKQAVDWFLVPFWLSVGLVTATVYVFDEPALGVFMLYPVMLLTHFFWHRKALVVMHLAAAAIAYTLPYATGVGALDSSLLLVSLPTFIIVAAMVGELSERFQQVRQGDRDRYKATIEALSTALTARDGYTGEHSQETLWFVRAVCDELGLEKIERDLIADVALLHDIGKIGIPNDVLHAPGRLDKEQWKIMKEHPVIGERIVATVPGLEDVARAIRHEHERWDGAGYPDGLRQGEIPLASRIVLVCDAYHAMTSDRPYRTAMSVREARAELSRHAGTQFDPVVVGALLCALDRFGPIPLEPRPVPEIGASRTAGSNIGAPGLA